MFILAGTIGSSANSSGGVPSGLSFPGPLLAFTTIKSKGLLSSEAAEKEVKN